MEYIKKEVEKLYGANIISEIHGGYSGDKVFLVGDDRSKMILRLSGYSDKKLSHINFSSEWMEYLSLRMKGIVKPLRSKAGNLYEIIGNGTQKYILSLQERARGQNIDLYNYGDKSDDLFFNLGSLMGQMHKLTQAYHTDASLEEFKWNGPHCWRFGMKIEDKRVAEAEKEMLGELMRMPITQTNYGIVHFDIHTDNFLVDGNDITLIDFDACQYNFYMADVESALFFIVQRGIPLSETVDENRRTIYAENALTQYLKGYLRYRTADREEIKNIGLFMRYQMIDEYFAAKFFYDEDPCERTKRYLDWHIDRIISRSPYVEIDFDKVLAE